MSLPLKQQAAAPLMNADSSSLFDSVQIAVQAAEQLLGSSSIAEFQTLFSFLIKSGLSLQG
jgi:hypothetical protein